MSQLQKIARGLTLFGSLLGVGYLFLGDGLSVLEVLTTLVVLVMAALSPASRVFDLVVLGLVALVYSAALSFPLNVESAGFTALLLTLGALQSGRPWATWGLIGGLSLGGLAIAVSFFRAGDHSTLGALGQLSFSLAWAGLVWLCREMRTDMPDLEPQRALSSEGQTDWIGKSLVCLAFCLPLGEGMGWFGMACLGFALAFHIKENGLDWRVFSIGRFGWPLGLWLVSGVLALWAGGFGWLDPGEVGRWGPLVALLGVLGAGRLAGAKWMGEQGDYQQ